MNYSTTGFPGGASSKEYPPSFVKAGDIRDVGSIPGPGRSHGGRHGNPLQYFCLVNPMKREAWWATDLGLQRVGHNWSDFSTHAHTHSTTQSKVSFIQVDVDPQMWRADFRLHRAGICLIPSSPSSLYPYIVQSSAVYWKTLRIFAFTVPSTWKLLLLHQATPVHLSNSYSSGS